MPDESAHLRVFCLHLLVGAAIGGLAGGVMIPLGWLEAVPLVQVLVESQVTTTVSAVIAGIVTLGVLCSFFDDIGCLLTIVVVVCFGGCLVSGAAGIAFVMFTLLRGALVAGVAGALLGSVSGGITLNAQAFSDA